MARNPLAVPYKLYDGAVTLWYLPYTTVFTQVAQDNFKLVTPAKKWQEYETCFVMLESFVIDAEFAAELPPKARAWQAYWSCRTSEVGSKENWRTFAQCAASFFSKDFWEGYNATRDASFAANEDLQPPAEGASPNE